MKYPEIGDRVGIRFDKRETGWGEYVSNNNRYRILNIPMADDLNIDDIVTAYPGSDGFLVVEEVLESKYPYKQFISYEKEDQFKSLHEKVHESGGKMEGWVGPRDGNVGICVVAFGDGFELERLVKEVGIKSPQSWELPR